jgi:hypothetical protein
MMQKDYFRAFAPDPGFLTVPSDKRWFLKVIVNALENSSLNMLKNDLSQAKKEVRSRLQPDFRSRYG